MPISREAAISFAQNNQERFLEDLKALGAIPSVSTDSRAAPEMARAAEWLASHLRKIGVKKVDIMPTAGNPVVYAEHSGAGSSAPTMLIYGHYDVQPAEPLELWHSGPFTPEIRGDYIYGRGITDMKGQVLASINAVEAVLKNSGLPVNVKFMLEGEEEIGSPNLAEFMRNNKDLLACDLALNPDSGILSADQPSITYALRGLAYFEIFIYGPDHDLHSGVFGGVVHNPGVALCELIAGMHNTSGKVTLPGFYDPVKELGPDERREIARIPQSEAYYLEHTGAPALWGEPDFTPSERTGARPTLEVNGLYSGYIGEGAKTVLPSYAMAKISMRLVPNQNPDDVHQQLNQYLAEHAPGTIRYEVKALAGSPASISDRESCGVKALSKAMQTVWGKQPIFKREGGSVPVVTLFQQILGVESVNTGFSMSGDNMHSPNEKLHLPTWRRGTQALIHFLYNLAEA